MTWCAAPLPGVYRRFHSNAVQIRSIFGARRVNVCYREIGFDLLTLKKYDESVGFACRVRFYLNKRIDPAYISPVDSPI